MEQICREKAQRSLEEAKACGKVILQDDASYLNEKARSFMKQMQEELHQLEMDLDYGIEICIREIQLLPSQERDPLIRELLQAYRSLEVATFEGSSYQEVLGLSDQSLHFYYATGLTLFSQTEYQQAAAVFRWVTFLQQNLVEGWICLGASLRELGMYDQAESALCMAQELSGDHPLVLIHLVHLYMAQKHGSLTRIVLDRLKEAIACSDSQDYQIEYEQLENMANTRGL